MEQLTGLARTIWAHAPQPTRAQVRNSDTALATHTQSCTLMQAFGECSACAVCVCVCVSAANQLRSATTWMGITTGAIMVSLMMKEVKASVLIGILFTTFLSWIPGTEVR